MEYITMVYYCSECGDVYRVKRADQVLKEGDKRKELLRKHGCLISHGYCPDCHREIKAKLSIMRRKQIDTMA